jgi:subtilase family serine protease
MKSLSFAVVLILFWSGLALPAASRQLAGHVPAAVASGKLAPLGRVAGTNQLRLAISLPLRNAAALTNLLRDIYDPASPQFHHYLTPAAFAERFGPTPADYAAVTRFARTNGFTVVAGRRRWSGRFRCGCIPTGIRGRTGIFSRRMPNRR